MGKWYQSDKRISSGMKEGLNNPSGGVSSNSMQSGQNTGLESSLDFEQGQVEAFLDFGKRHHSVPSLPHVASVLKPSSSVTKSNGFSPSDCDGIHISSCGHAVHQECHDCYLSSLKQRENFFVQYVADLQIPLFPHPLTLQRKFGLKQFHQMIAQHHLKSLQPHRV